MRLHFKSWKSADTGHPVWPGPMVGSLLVGICAAALSLSGAGDLLEQRFGLWALLHLRGPRTAPEEVVIVALPSDTGDRISIPRQRSEDMPCNDIRVDETTATHRPLGDVPQRWGRCHFVELMRRLAAAKPRVVAFDVAFRPRDDVARAEDRAVASAMRDSHNVILAQKTKIRWLPGRIAVEEGPVELSRDIARAAIGIAPTPLPQQPFDRIDQFQTFIDGPWSAPTLPALALQVYTLEAYRALLSGLRRVMPEAATDLPEDSQALVRNGQLEVHMLHLRGVLLTLLRNAYDSDMPVDLGATDVTESQADQLHALLDLYTRDNLRYLNLYGPPGTIRTIHVADVIAVPGSLAASDPLHLHNKAVFVGYSDKQEWEIQEKFATAYGGGLTKISGVELLATAFANLLHTSALTAASAWAKLPIAFVAGSGIALLCYAKAIFSATLISVTAAAAYLGISVFVLARINIWLPVFIPLAVAAPAGYMFAISYKLIHYKRDRSNLRDILGKFVAPQVRHLLEENAKQLDHIRETTNVACVITDIEGFTALSAKLSSERMLDLLSEYFGAILKPVADYGGFVSDLRGDSIFAIWPDRTSETSVRERVCEACLELQAAVDRFNSSHPDSRMPTRIGVNYGVVTLATVGSLAHRMQYSAIGDTANTASRIEHLSKDLGTYLLVAAPMTDGLSRFLVRDLGEFSLRGRTTPTRIVELLGQHVTASPQLIELCRRFFEAKKAFDSSKLRRAQIELQSLLKDFPEDGPSKYLLRIIERQL